MDPISLALGGASLLGNVFSSMTNAQASEQNTQAQIAAQQQMLGQTEQFNASQVQQQEAYQTQMSNTAYQRASQDMQKAGLNPMMMFGSGGAASSPGGAAASIGTPTAPMPQKGSAWSGIGSVGDAIKTSLNSAVNAKLVDKMTEEVATQKAITGETLARKAVEEGVPAVQEATKADLYAAAGLKDQVKAIQYPAEAEATGVAQHVGGSALGWAGAAKYGVKSLANDIIQPIVSSATGVGRVGQAFSDLETAKLARDINKGNFIGKYGTPIDEYLAQ